MDKGKFLTVFSCTCPLPTPIQSSPKLAQSVQKASGWPDAHLSVRTI